MDVNEILDLSPEWDGESFSDAEPLNVYTEEYEKVGVAPRFLCHRLGLIHEVVYCLITDSDGRFLLQTRGGGRLDISVGGHLEASDDSPKDALVREVKEEVGIPVRSDGLVKLGKYFREGGDRLSKPRYVNREWRHLYSYTLDQEELDRLDKMFSERTDKAAILDVNWFSMSDVIRACDRNNAADGLSASVVHYLSWRLSHSEKGQ
jgi:8-oxo-dGTP pyrophosphatase MutT (NUDIX family)